MIAKKKKRKKTLKSIGCILLCIIFILLPMQEVNAANNLKLYYDKKNVTYTGQKVTYKLGSKTLNNPQYPGIIISGTSLTAPEIFTNKSIGAKYSYNSKTDKIVFQKGGLDVQLQIGKTIAYIDGKKTTVSVAPKKVRFLSTGKTRIMVPARFVAEALGYTYSWNSKTSIATLKLSPEQPLQLYYDKKWNIYRGTQAKVTFDGKNVPVTDMPGIMLNQTTLVQAKKVFADSPIKAVYSYQSDKKTVTIKKGSTTIVMKLDSKQATVNGVKKTMSTSAKQVKNKKNNTWYIMVPADFVAKQLGYNYQWNSKTKTSVITTKKVITVPDVPADEPDTSSDEPVILPPKPDNTDKKEYVSFSMTDEVKNEYKSIDTNKEQSIHGGGSLTTLTYVQKESNDSASEEVYKFTASSPFSKVSGKFLGDMVLELTFDQISAQDSTYYYQTDLLQSIKLEADSANSKLKASINLNQPNTAYKISLSEDKTCLYLTIYKNYISGMTVYREGSQDIISLTGLYGLDAELTENQDSLTLLFHNTKNGIGIQNEILPDNCNIKSFDLNSINDFMTQLTIEKVPDSKYRIEKTDSEYKIIVETEEEEVPDKTPDDISSSLQIKLPSSISAKEVTDTDLYYKNQFKITIPGNQLDYYAQNPVQYNHPNISDVSYSISSTGDTDILVNTTKLQGYKLSKGSNTISVSIGNPRDIYDKIVVLDAGHGGTDPGAIREGKNEKDITFKILYTYAKEYFNSESSTIKAYWSRYNDTKISLEDRAAYAKKVGADLFISLHMNTAGSTTAKGTEIYYSSTNKNSMNGMNSKELASIFLNQIVWKLDMGNRGVKDNAFYVTKYNSVPAILIELGFLSNSSDFSKLTNASFQKNAAKAIYDAAEAAFVQYPTGR